jgi:hypothetical protein
VYLSKVKCPVIALNGTKDSQVSCKENLDEIKNNLIKANNINFVIVPLPGLNHLFQAAITGAESEYGEIEETVNPAALDVVVKWLNEL